LEKICLTPIPEWPMGRNHGGKYFQLLLNIHKILVPLLVFFSGPSCTDPVLPVAGRVDLKRFMGKWYEISALPAGVHKGCNCTSFEYKLSADGSHIMVINSCIKKGKQGAVLARAYTDENSGFAKWQLEVFRPFKKDFFLLEIAQDYSYAMAGQPDRKELWILGRQPQLDNVVYNQLVAKAQSLGFDTSKLILTDHNCGLVK
jgi:apolipoprotein D and lipocalin family protein